MPEHAARWHVNSFTTGMQHPSDREPDPWRHRGPHHVPFVVTFRRAGRLARRLGVSRHRSRPVLPRRHDRPGHRADRERQGRVLRECEASSPASTSPSPPTRTRASGAAPPRRSAASCAASGSPPGVAPADLNLRTPAVPAASPRGGRPASGHERVRQASGQACYWRTGTDRLHHGAGALRRALAGEDLDRAGQLGGHQRAHDRQPETGAGLHVKPSGGPTPSSATMTSSASPSLASSTGDRRTVARRPSG